MSLTRDDQQIDPISAASAGMLALGVAPDRRSHALMVLAEMLDRADVKGRVKLDGAMFAVEQKLGVDDCVDAYALLEKTGVARRTPTGWAIRSIAAHRGPAGATAASMAVLARQLEENARESGIERRAVLAGPPSEGAAQLAEIRQIGTARPQVAASTFVRRMPVMAGGVAAAAALLFGILSFTGRLETPDRDTNLASRSSSLPSAPAAAGPVGTVGEVTGSASPAVTAATKAGSVPASGGALAASTGLSCVLPDIRVASLDLAVVPDVLGTPTWTALVTGTVTNTGDSVATLDGVKIVLDAGDGVLTDATALLSVAELAPGASATFSGVVPAGSVEPTNPTATATAANWKSAGC